ncbi:unnamed protein product [Rhizophagus irregularis]|nr:unnamed protein product [Rhizophagus irregularis]
MMEKLEKFSLGGHNPKSGKRWTKLQIDDYLPSELLNTEFFPEFHFKNIEIKNFLIINLSEQGSKNGDSERLSEVSIPLNQPNEETQPGNPGG